MSIKRSGKEGEILTIWSFWLTCEKVGSSFQCHHSGARFPAYGFGFVRLSVQSNCCTFAQSRAKNHCRNRVCPKLGFLKYSHYLLPVLTSVKYQRLSIAYLSGDWLADEHVMIAAGENFNEFAIHKSNRIDENRSAGLCRGQS